MASRLRRFPRPWSWILPRQPHKRAWSIPKCEYGEQEDPLDAAKREFEEETGIKPAGEFVSLDQMKQPGGKIVRVWAVEGDCWSEAIRSNTFSMECPPKSGCQQEFPEVTAPIGFHWEMPESESLGPGRVFGSPDRSLPIAPGHSRSVPHSLRLRIHSLDS